MSLLTKKQAIEFLGIGRTRFDNLLKSGDLKCKKVGNAIMFTERNLQEWLDTPNYPTKYIREKEVVSTNSKSILLSTDNEYSFEKVRDALRKTKLNSTLKKDLPKLYKALNLEPTKLN